MSDIAMKEPGVESAVAFPGLSINGFINSPSAGIVFVTLKPFEERTTRDLSGFAISQKLQAKFAAIADAVIAIFPPPPVNGLGTIAGFKLQVEDRTDQGNEALNRVMGEIQAKAAKTPQLMAVFSNFNIRVPQLEAHVDRIKAMQLGVEVQDIFDTMSTTSTVSAAPTKSSRRPTRRFGLGSTTFCDSRSAIHRAKWCRSARW